MKRYLLLACFIIFVPAAAPADCDVSSGACAVGGGGRRRRGLTDTMSNLKSFFDKINLEIPQETEHFGTWVKDSWDAEVDDNKKNHGTVKAIAMKYIKHGKNGEVSGKVRKQASIFFEPHKDHLGALYTDIESLTQKAGDDDEDNDGIR